MGNCSVNSSKSTNLIHFAFPDNPSAENSNSSADFSIQLIPLLECMGTGCSEQEVMDIIRMGSMLLRPILKQDVMFVQIR